MECGIFLLVSSNFFGACLSLYKHIDRDWFHQWRSGVPPAEISMSRYRKGRCGLPTKVTADKVEAIVRVNTKYKGKLSLRKLAANSKRKKVFSFL